jgi:plasmid stability protein
VRAWRNNRIPWLISSLGTWGGYTGQCCGCHCRPAALFWRQNAARMVPMTVTLSIKNVPDDLAQKLKERAARNHRSLQGELMAILEAAEPPKRSIKEIYEMVKASGVKTPSESARMIREDRDDPSR